MLSLGGFAMEATHWIWVIGGAVLIGITAYAIVIMLSGKQP